MLVILSDLHLNDGTTGPSLSPGAFPLLAARLRELAVAASWRADDVYRPIEQIDLVLLGDILDPLCSRRWTERPAVRPWPDPLAADVAEQVARITADILAHNREGLAVLRGLAAEGTVRVPPALRLARPALEADDEPVRVRIHYMVGEHDWFYHLPGAAYNAIRETIVDALGLVQFPLRPLPHEIAENADLLPVMRRHKVTARHGDAFDPLAYAGDRQRASPTDAIQIELLGRLAGEVEAALGDDLPRAAALALADLGAVRPLALVPRWLEGMLERTCESAVRKRVQAVWERLVEELLASAAFGGDACGGPELADGLRRLLLRPRRTSAAPSRHSGAWLRDLRAAAGDRYASVALAEQDFRSRRSKYVVYGHTHRAEIVPLDASHADGCVLDQVYFNAGTWRRVWRPAEFSPGQTDFVACDAMTYLVFYQADERKGRPYETWSGTLGHSPAERLALRLDAGRVHPASAPSAAAPHFAPRAGRPGGQARQSLIPNP